MLYSEAAVLRTESLERIVPGMAAVKASQISWIALPSVGYLDGAEHHWGRSNGQIHLIVALVVFVLLPVAVALVAVALAALYLLVSREYDVLSCLTVQASEGMAAVVGGEESHRLIEAA